MNVTASQLLSILTERSKILPRSFLYDEVGSALFAKLRDAPEYKLARTEQALLTQYLGRIATPEKTSIVDLGCGDGAKFFEALQQAHMSLAHYIAVDESEAALRFLRQGVEQFDLVAHYSTFNIDILSFLHRLRTHEILLDFTHIQFLGSTIGNLSATEQRDMLSYIAHVLPAGARLLVGFDLRKQPADHKAAYSDKHGYSALSGLNFVAQINRCLDVAVPFNVFEHHVDFDEASGDIRTYLRCVRSYEILSKSQGIQVLLNPGDTLQTNIAHKFTIPEIEGLTADSGLIVDSIMTDDSAGYALLCARRNY